MANPILGLGSRGNEVTELQKMLNEKGYKLDIDGVYGPQTTAVVKDYQMVNGLTVDGVAGGETIGSLQGDPKDEIAPTGSAAADEKRQEVEAQKPGEFSYADYVQSDAVTQAQALLQQQLNNRPGEYQSRWQEQINEILNRIMNREEFSYDMNSDALYQQYKDQYTLLGQQAMMDTMGQAAAMTGGYGNSYAQSVGQQAYQGYLQKLNDVMPELYQLALQKYQMEGDEMYNQYGLFMDQENQDYGRYRDKVSDYYTELQRLTEDARYKAEEDYGKYIDGYNMAYGQHRDSVSDYQAALDRADSEYWNERSMEYQQDRDKVADEQWQKEYEFALKQYNDSKKTYSGGSSGGSGGGGSSGGSGGSSSGGGSTGGNSGGGSTGGTKTSGVSDDIRSKLDGFKSNTQVEAYLERLEAAGTIDHETALQLMAEYMDDNEVYAETKNKDGSTTKAASYSSMVKSTGGWKVVDDGGTNWFWGVDNNARVEAPNGEQIRLDNLVDKLVAEGMSKKEAKDYVKKLQKNLGI